MNNELRKIEEMLYENNSFMKLKNIIKNKRRTIFNIIVKDSDELTFSRTLKYFLDPHEDHNLDDYFLREFLYKYSVINKSDVINRLYFDSLNLKECTVFREFSIQDFGRIDIFVSLENEFALLIENKLYSEEGDGQTTTYEKWAYKNLSEQYKYLLFIYLTVDGKQADSERFVPISINNIIPIFNNESILNLLNHDNKYLIEHFTQWMEDLKMTDNNVKKLCQIIYKKYKKEINLIIENAPTITSFLKDLTEYINKKRNGLRAHSGKNWMTICPEEWINNDKLKSTSKYSKINIQFTYVEHSEKFFMSLVIPDTHEYNAIIKLHSEELFSSNIESVESWKNWYNIYLTFEKWESFQIDNFIDNWDNNVESFSNEIIKKMERVEKILSNELIN